MKMTDFARVFQPIPLTLNYRLISTIRYLQRLFIHKKITPARLACLCSKVSSLSPFARLISILKSQCNMSRLAKKIMRWFDESKGNAKSFDYMFTGQESCRFLHNFMYMISAIEGENDSTQASMKLHIFAFAILSLRNAISLYRRFSIDEAQLNELDKECSIFFICCALYLEVNPTVWTIGNVVPVHTRDIFQKNGKGLLINSMEGREAKHLAISRYATNSTNITRWQ